MELNGEPNAAQNQHALLDRGALAESLAAVCVSDLRLMVVFLPVAYTI